MRHQELSDHTHKRGTVFLDRDGVINRLILERGPRESPCTPNEVQLLPQAREALRRLKFAGFRLIVVTNQPNVAKGKSTFEEANAINERMQELLGDEASVDEIYVCWHHPDPAQVVVQTLLADCDCRKPKPGLILDAAQKHQIDLATAWLIGDTAADIDAGRNAGIPLEHLISVGDSYHNGVSVDHLLGAAEHIIQQEIKIINKPHA